MKEFALALWANHKKKVITFLLALLLTAIAAVTGLPLTDVKEAAREAAGPAPEFVIPNVSVPAVAK